MLTLAIALGCHGPTEPVPWSAEEYLSPVVPTVARVRVESEADLSDVAVLFGEEARAEAVPVSGGWEALLVGNKASAEVPWSVVASVDGVEVLGPEHTLSTGGVPSDFAAIGVTVADPDRAWHGFLVTTFMSTRCHPVILDGDGDLVWWYDSDEPETRLARLAVSHDRSHLLYMHGQPPERELVRLSWEGEVLERTRVPKAHHDFVELPDGTLAFLVEDGRRPEGELVIGDKLVEWAPDGTETELWTAWDHFEYDPDSPSTTVSMWSHANAIDHDPLTDTYTLSMRNLSALVHIDGETGEQLWQLGGIGSDFQVVPPAQAFTKQHQFHLRHDEVLVFDNGSEDSLESRAAGYTLDGTSATLSFEHRPDPPLYSLVLGDVSRLDDGTTLVVFGLAGQVDQVADDGEVVWRANLSLGTGFGYATWRSSLYDEP